MQLPFQLNPSLKTYQLKAFELGIMEAHEDSIRPWIYNRYINQLYMIKDRRFTYTNYDRWHALEGVTECQKVCVEVKQIYARDSGLDIIALIDEMLKSGHYIYGRYNEFYIPGKAQYQKNYFCHDFILYGLNIEENSYYSAGYLADGHYKGFLIPKDAFHQSLVSVKGEKLNFHFIKYKNGIQNHLDLRMIYEDLFDYIHSINRRQIVNDNKIFGIDCETVFIDYLNGIQNKDSYIPVDLRHSKLFFELKSLMFERLQYLASICIIEQEIANNYSNVLQMQQLIHGLCLKYNINHDIVNLVKAQNMQSDIIKLEKELLSNSMGQISKAIVERKPL